MQISKAFQRSTTHATASPFSQYKPSQFSVTSLRQKLERDAHLHRADNVRILQENVALIKWDEGDI